MAKYAVQSRLSLARNLVVTENLRFRSLPLLQAENRYPQFLPKFRSKKSGSI